MTDFKRRKILHIINGLHTGGAEMMLYKLLSGTNRERFEAEVVTLIDGGEVRSKVEKLGVKVHSLHIPRNSPDIASAWRLIRCLRQSQPDLIQTWMYQSDLVAGVLGKLFTRTPIVWNIRCSHPGWAGQSTLRIAKTCAFLSGTIPARIICGSVSASHDHIEMGYRREKVIVIPNGFDLETFQPDAEARLAMRKELQLAPETKLVGMFARFALVKDPANFVRAAASLHRKMPEVHFVMCGAEMSWEHQQLADWIAQAGVRERFHLLGQRHDVSRYMAAMDVVVLSSESEGFPNVLGEAMACGVPCVATDTGDSALIIGDTGKIVPRKEPEKLAEACEALLHLSDEERRQLGLAARRRIEENYSLPTIVRKYEQLYQGLLTPRNGKH